MDKTIPKLTIVIPFYNQNPVYLLAAVKSALNQTLQNITVIASDNHSNNGCSNALESIDDERLVYIKPTSHLNIVDHFAFASSNVKTKYLSFLASDDLVEPDFAESLLPILESDEGLVMAFGELENVSHDNINHIRYVYRNNQQATQRFSYNQYLDKLLKFNREIGWMIGSIIKTESYFQAGGVGRDQLSYSADYSLLLRLLEIGDIFYLNKVTGKNRFWSSIHGKTDSVRIVKSIQDYKKLKSIILETHTDKVEKIERGFYRLKFKHLILFVWHVGNKELSSGEVNSVLKDDYFHQFPLKFLIKLLLVKPLNWVLVQVLNKRK